MLNLRNRKKPTIVHIHPWQFTMGGAQRFICSLSNHFKTFTDVHIITPRARPGENVCWTHLLKGITLHEISSPEEGFDILQDLNPDLIHHHHPQGGYMFQKIQGRWPIVGTQHGWDDNMRVRSCVTPICGDSPDVVRHGVDLDHFKPLKKRKGHQGLIIGMAGRLSLEKFPKSFLEALQAWKPGAGITIRVIGGGAKHCDTNWVNNLFKELPFVDLVGEVSPDKIADLYRDLDFLLIPSDTDSVSFVGLEALACGVPLIARNKHGLPYTVGDAGFLFDTDEEALGMIKNLKSNKRLLTSLRKKARKRAEENFDEQRMLKEYEDIYSRRTGGLIRQPGGFDCSVIIPVWNANPSWLREAVESVVSQMGCRFELVMVDDGSDHPSTLAELEAIEKEFPSVVVLIRSDHLGVGNALNVGIRAARSNIIARFDSDDIMVPDRLKIQLEFLKANNVDLLSGQMEVFDGHSGNTSLVYHPQVPLWKQPWCIAHPTVMGYRYQIMKVGGYIPSGPAQDFDLWCRLQRAGIKIRIHSKIIHKRRVHKGAVTSGNFHLERAAEIREWNEYQARNMAASPMGHVRWKIEVGGEKNPDLKTPEVKPARVKSPRLPFKAMRIQPGAPSVRSMLSFKKKKTK